MTGKCLGPGGRERPRVRDRHRSMDTRYKTIAPATTTCAGISNPVACVVIITADRHVGAMVLGPYTRSAKESAKWGENSGG